MEGETRLVATSLEGFVQQVAVACIGKGYFYYVTGRVPEGKDPRSVDRKLAERYGATISKWSRYRRERGGHANVRYLRHEGFFVLFATDGVSPFFHHEAGLIRDCRREPFKYGGYSISSKAGRVCVRIEREQYNVLKAVFLEERDRDEVCREFGVDRSYLRVLLHRAKQEFKSEYLRHVPTRAPI